MIDNNKIPQNRDVPFRVLKGYNSPNLKVTINSHTRYSGDGSQIEPNTIIYYEKTALNGYVWFNTKPVRGKEYDPENIRFRTQSGSIYNMIKAGVIELVQ